MLAEKVPHPQLVDHGPALASEISNNNPVYKNYVSAREKGKQIVPQPGDRIPIKGIDVQVVTNQGHVLTLAPWPEQPPPTRPAG